ncbi:MAG TPA: hypothetical protein VM582_03515, partial [Candidatus Thermoplasmatota archaeon]|nr:hypothetical protein [Candidatus Thermoplasmatota archaeon]
THAMYIGGPNNRTDADKQTSIQMDGNGSALFDARYRGRHHELTAYGAEYTLVTGQNTRRVFAIGASVGFGSHGSVGAEVFRVETSSDSGWAYTYTFSPSGKWYITNVGPGLRSFCMTNRTWCDP